MSVNAINAAEPQQKGNPMASALATGVGLGAVAGGVGYYVGNKRPDLDKVFAMPKDKFEAATKEAGEDLKTDVEKIAAGRKEFKDVCVDGTKAVNEEAKKLNSLARSASVEDTTLAENVEKYEKELKGKSVEITNAAGEKETVKMETVINNVNKAKKELADAAENEKAAKQTALNNAMEDYKAFKKHEEIKEIRKNLREAQRALGKAQWQAIEADEAAKGLKDSISKLQTKNTEARTSKLSDLTSKQEYKDAFAKIQKLFPKEGGKKIGLIAAGVAAAIGLIGGYIMGNKQA